MTEGKRPVGRPPKAKAETKPKPEKSDRVLIMFKRDHHFQMQKLIHEYEVAHNVASVQTPPKAEHVERIDRAAEAMIALINKTRGV